MSKITKVLDKAAKNRWEESLVGSGDSSEQLKSRIQKEINANESLSRQYEILENNHRLLQEKLNHTLHRLQEETSDIKQQISKAQIPLVLENISLKDKLTHKDNLLKRIDQIQEKFNEMTKRIEKISP